MDKLELVKKNTVEIVTEEEMKEILKKESPSVYCGYEPSGPIHLGHMVTINKLMQMKEAGFKVKVLLADIHALSNRKGNEEFIAEQVKIWEKSIKAIGLNAEFIVGSDYQFSKEYLTDVIKLSLNATIKRGLRSMQEVARDIQHARISQLLYPVMQIADIKHLGVDVAVGGMEQRKIHMLGREIIGEIGHKFTAVHTPLIVSLLGPETKMSSSVPNSNISVTDSKKDIENKIKRAYCPPKETENNPIYDIARLVILPALGKFKIERPAKYGGDLEISNIGQLKKEYTAELHPADLKNGVAISLEKIISKIRKNFNS
jgi:tyrosyl-tRNA synthetase